MLKTLTLIALALGVAGIAWSDTMDRVAIAPELGVDALTRDVAREHLDRELFSNPYASVVIANIDIYDEFPYLEARYFQVISDPGWNRLLAGETGGGMFAFTGAGTPFGEISEPRGLSQGHGNRIYLSDTGNNRILVLDASSEYDQIQLVPVAEITGLHRPYDVAYSDWGTPDDPTDDRLYVAEAGRNRVLSYALEESGAVLVSSIGDLGSGPGHFAGPLAISVGRYDGTHNRDVYVADAHNQRVVRLQDDGKSLNWTGEWAHGFDVVTSLDTDHWGNLYLAGPNHGVAKLSANLEPLVEVTSGTARPRSFHVVFANIHDHTTGSEYRSGQAKGILLESWSPRTGVSLMSLGVELKDLKIDVQNGVDARFLLTDRARVHAEIADPMTGSVMARIDAGVLDAGTSTVSFAAEDFFSNLGSGSYLLRVMAKADNREAATIRTEAVFSTSGTGFTTPNRPLLLGNSPNPFTASTRIQFLVPDRRQPASVKIFNLQGRLIRTLLDGDQGPGVVSINWDGRNDSGRNLGSGIYFYRVIVGEHRLVSKMILVR